MVGPPGFAPGLLLLQRNAIVCCSDPKFERDARAVINFILAVPYSTAIRWGLARYQATCSEQLLV